MPAVTQRVDNYLGGVSRQSDDKKLPGQVEECINGYPDPTFGLTKRPGFQHIANLGTGTIYDNSKWFFISRTETEKYIGCITPAVYNNASPPVLQSTGNIYIWNAITGVAITPTFIGSSQSYLTGARTDYDILTIQDKSIITNRLVTTAAVAAPTFTPNRQATIRLSGTSLNTTYSGTINGQTFTVTTGSTDGYVQALTQIKNAIDSLGISGLTVTRFKDNVHLERTSSFTFSVTGGDFEDQANGFQDQVATLAEIPSESKHGHVVKIANSGLLTSAYFLRFVANDGVSGDGFWEETVSPSVSTGLDASTMPHQLVNTAPDTFEVQPVPWVNRVVGDDETNKHPSFVGQKINQSFFHNNRLGFLSADTISMSQSGDFFNMYHASAQTVVDSDPIDLSANALKPVALHSVLPTTQGLVLFSANQQFLMSSSDGILTPTKTSIRTISSYEMDTVVDPVDTGTGISFISKTPSYTRVFTMVTRGENQNPIVSDIGKVVNEWIPSTIDTFIPSAQNQFIAFSGQSTRYIYFFRQYSEGNDVKLQTWFNWLAPGNVQTIATDSDEFFAVTKQGGQFTLSKASLSQSPDDAIIVNNDGQRLNPCIDLYAPASSVVYDAAGEFSKCFIPYNDATNLTPVIIIKGTTATGQFIESGFTISPERVVESGNTYFKVPVKDLTSIASDVIVGYKYDFDVILPKTYYKIDNEMRRSDFTANLTIARMKFAVGLSGLMAFKLKSKGVRQGKREYIADGVTTDYNWINTDINYIDDVQIKVKQNNVETTAFTVDRTGDLPKITLNSPSTELKNLTGNGTTDVFDLTFVPTNIDRMKVKVNGVDLDSTQFIINGQFIHFTTPPPTPTPPATADNVLVYSADEIIIYIDEWYNLNPVVIADNYLANDIPVSDQTIFTLPIHQRTDNFTLRLFNDSPFPVSLNSMMWEGMYSPRFYRRT